MARSASKSPREDEDGLHMAVADMLRVCWPSDLEWLHVPNGGERVKIARIDRRTGREYRFSPEAQKLQRMGVRKGAWDLWFQLPRGQYGWIELKVPGGELSDEQADFGERIGAHGGGRAVCYSIDQVRDVLARWLALFGRELRRVAA